MRLCPCRNLATLGIPARLITTRGSDEWGGIFLNAMQRAKVDVEHVMVRGPCTGRSVVMACNGSRTMRTYLDDDNVLQVSAMPQQQYAYWFYFDSLSAVSHNNNNIPCATKIALHTTDPCARSTTLSITCPSACIVRHTLQAAFMQAYFMLCLHAGE